MKKFFAFFLFFCFSLLFLQNIQASNLEDCFNYYDYGKVKVFLTAKKPNYQAGETAEFIGQIDNDNKFPIADGILYAHLKRINQDKQSAVNNGHFLIEKLTLAEDLNLLPRESKNFTFQLPLDKNLMSGEYKLSYFIFTNNQFYYSGRAFLEGDVAGYSQFNVKNDSAEEFYFDINEFKVDGKAQAIKKNPFNIFNKTKLNFEVPLINNYSEGEIQATASLFSFDDSFDELLLEQKLLDIKNNVAVAQFDFTKNGAYVVQFEIKKPVATILKFRFSVESELLSSDLTLRLADLNIDSYPLDNSRAYVCFHSPLGEIDSNRTSLKLQILDENKKILSETVAVDEFSADVLALALDVSKITNKNNFYLKAEVNDLENQQKSYENLVHFSADDFSNSIAKISISRDDSILNLKTFNVAGKEIQESLINEFIVYNKNTKEIVDEQYRIKIFPYQFNLSHLKPGLYQAKAVSGSVTEVFDFEIENKLNFENEENKQTSNFSIYVTILLILFLTLILLVFLRSTKNVKKES